LFWRKIIELQQARNFGEKQSELLFDSLRVFSKLSISAAKDAPAVVNEAVLTEKIVLVLDDRHRRGVVMMRAIYFEGDAALGRF
jgi:hypothetical protein